MDLPSCSVMLWRRTCQAWGLSPSSLPGGLGTWRRGKVTTPVYTLVFSERTEEFILRCPLKFYISSPQWPGRTGGNDTPKLQLFQEKRENSRFPLRLREILRSSKKTAWGSCLALAGACCSGPLWTSLEACRLFFLTGAPYLSLGEDPGNENSSERMNCGWQRGALGEVSC